MKTMKLAVAAFLMLGALPLAACDNKGPAEKAGQQVDKAAQKVEDAINPPGPVEKAGRAVDNAVNSATNSN